VNPFIRLFEAPVETLIVLGYALALLTLFTLTLAACWRNVVTVHVQWKKQRPHQWEYLPPAGWLLRVAAIPAILAVDSWAVSALICLVF
jgi:hypothetical protein